MGKFHGDAEQETCETCGGERVLVGTQTDKAGQRTALIVECIACGDDPGVDVDDEFGGETSPMWDTRSVLEGEIGGVQ